MTRLRFSAAAILMATAIVGCGTPGDKAGGHRAPTPVVLSLAHAVDVRQIRPFLDEVARLSQGSMRIEPRPVPRTASGDDEAAVLDEVLAGRADLGISSAERLPEGLTKIGVLPGPIIRPVGIGRALLGLDSYRGARIAVTPSAPEISELTALGATTVPHNLLGDELTVADAAATSLANIASNVYDGIATTLTANVILGSRSLIVFWRRPIAGDLLNTAAIAAVPASIELRRTEENAAVAALCRRARIEFVVASDADVEALRSALGRDPRTAQPPTCAGVDPGTATTLLDGVYDVTTNYGIDRMTLDRGQFEGTWARGNYVVRGDLLTMTNSADHTTIVCRWILYDDKLTLYPVDGTLSPDALSAHPWRRTGDPPLPPRTRLDGVYEISASSDGYRWTFDRGQFHQSRESLNAWAVGSYAVTGDLVHITYSQTGGEDPTRGPVRAGDTAVYRWNLYRGRLHLRAVDGANSPTTFRGAWRRVGDAP